jgi:nickel-dependent lactate racemase
VRIKLAYGQSGLMVDMPSQSMDLIEPRFMHGLTDEAKAIQEALERPIGSAPLRDIAAGADSVAIIFSDRTRPMPSDRVLPVILSELGQVPRNRITLINALGTHRENTPGELEAMLGRPILENYRVIQHNPHDRMSMVHLGTSRFGNDVWVNREFFEAKVKILTGFIEPHFFAGFSGGPKSVLLGVAAFESILRNHSAPMIDDPRSTWGILEGNPIHEEMVEIAKLVRPDFIVNVTLNKYRAITGVFAGDWKAAHAAGCAFVGASVMRPVARPYDVVVTTNSGFPLDLNLYQTVKGMSAAARIVREGGAIVLASECSDGVPEHGNFRQLLRTRKTPSELWEMIRGFPEPVHDQWQVQILAGILMKANVYLYSTLPDDEVLAAHLIPVHDIPELIQRLQKEMGPGSLQARWNSGDFRIAVMPEGPQTVPYIV